MHLVSWAGYPPQSRLLPTALAAGMWFAGWRRTALFQLAAWGPSFASAFFKFLMRRPRPAHPEVRVAIARLGGSSFPSGHVLNYTGTYGFLAYVVQTLVPDPRLRRPLVAALLAKILLVGPSRIYQGHHWSSDVLASYLFGTSYVLVLATVHRALRHRFDRL